MSRVVAPLLAAVAFGGCADLIGAEFDVDPLGEGAGASTATTGNGTTSTVGGGGEGGGGDVGCPAGSTTLVADAEWPYGIAVGRTGVADGWVYFTELAKGGGRVRRIRSDGSGGPELVIDNLHGPSRIVINDLFAYFPESGTGTSDGMVRRASVESAKVEIVASSVSSPNGIALSSTDLFWTTTEVENERHWVYRRPLDDSQLESKFALVPKSTLFLTVSGDKLFGTSEVESKIWFKGLAIADGPKGVEELDTTASFRPSTIRPKNSGVVVVSYLDGKARSWDLNLQSPKMLGDGMGDLGDLAVVADTAYWADYTAGVLYKNAVDGGTATKAAKLGNINGVAGDDEAIYVTQHTGPGVVCRIPLSAL